MIPLTHKLKIDLLHKGVIPRIDAVQDDANSRAVEIQLYYDGKPYEGLGVLEGAVGYRKPDGTSGLYDTLPNGEPAVVIDPASNVVPVILAPQVLTCPGLVKAVLTLRDTNLDQISTFPFLIDVAPNPATGQSVSNDYYNYQTLGDINAELDAINSTLDYYGEQLQDHWAMLDTINAQLVAMEPAVKDAAPVIIATASGTDQADCSDGIAGKPLRRLRVYGHTNLTGTPTMENPAQITSDGKSDYGDIIYVENGTDTVEISVSGGLAGVHASKNGNFTDENGQQWWSDSIECESGTAFLMRRVTQLTLTGDEDYMNNYYPEIVLNLPFPEVYANVDTLEGAICNYPINHVYVGNAYGSTIAFSVAGQFSSADAFQSWVKERYQSGKPVVVCYGLKTPVTEALTATEVDALAALTMTDRKQVYGENSEYFVVDYVADTKGYIDRKFDELSKALDALIGGGA